MIFNVMSASKKEDNGQEVLARKDGCVSVKIEVVLAGIFLLLYLAGFCYFLADIILHGEKLGFTITVLVVAVILSAFMAVILLRYFLTPKVAIASDGEYLYFRKERILPAEIKKVTFKPNIGRYGYTASFGELIVEFKNKKIRFYYIAEGKEVAKRLRALKREGRKKKEENDG